MELLKRYKGYIFLVLIVFLTLRVFIPQLDDLKQSILALQDANLYWIGFGLLVFATTPLIAAAQYIVLALKPLNFYTTFKVQMACLFASKLLPSGFGSISLNMYYMVKKGYSASQATAVTTMDALASGIAYALLMIGALTASTVSLQGAADGVELPTNLLIFIAILLLGAGYFLYRSGELRQKIAQLLGDFKQNFKSYRHNPKAIISSIFLNGLCSFATIVVLYASALAVGVDISIAEALLAYTFGNIAATLIPTPGGIGATEAGIYSGLVLSGVDGPDALVVTLLYRLISYWLPIVPGYLYFNNLRRDLLSGFHISNKNSP